ncbi:DUF1761 domain-containing protein [Allosphingosinicella sp.]|jgi:hypothetical protein|uniref:DUF1761 domain-containing protein n=1 Tax=Allosphingosinicella sp. TaxID=2823234 RepID=UPI002EFAB496
MPDVNWIAILLCGVSSMLLGALWYSPLLFGRAWQRGAGLSDEDLARGNMALIYGGAFLLSMVAAIVFSHILGPHRHLGEAIAAGAGTGAFLVAAAFGINYLFERRSTAQWLINGGYHTLQFALFGLVLAHFH